MKARSKRIEPFLSSLTASQNKAQGYLLAYKNIQLATRTCKIHNVWHPTKIARHTKKEKYTAHNEKKKSIETDPEVTQIIASAEKDIESFYNCIPYIQDARGKTEQAKERHRRYFKSTKVRQLLEQMQENY